MLMETVPDDADSRQLIKRGIVRIEESLVRVESHLVRSDERWALEFKTHRELMQKHFEAVDKKLSRI